MVNEYSDIIQKNKNAVTCYLAVNYHCQQSLLEVLHSHNVPRDPQKLYDFFNTKENKAIIDELKKKKVLKDDQVKLLLPLNQRTFSNKWDITLTTVVIINFSSLPPPTNGWKNKNPDPTDSTPAAFVLLVRNTRNNMNHATLDSLKDDNKFNNQFNEVDRMLVGLKYAKIADFRALKSKSFNPVLFMDAIQCPKEKEDVYAKCLQHYKEENEKSKFVILIVTCICLIVIF